ncbi:MAG: SET domain-containing protein [Afipia sp.]
MPEISSNKPYRIGRSKTGLGLFATEKIKKGTKIIRYFGPMLDSKNKKHDDIDNKYLFEINNRWTIDGSVRKNIARYINHACRPNAESDVNSRKRKVVIRAIKAIQPGEEINYDYGTDYFKIFLKPIGCKCEHCEKKRAKKRAEARAEKLRLKLKAEKKAAKKALKDGKKADKALKTVVKAAKSKAAPKRKTVVLNSAKANPHARGSGKPTKTKAARTKPLSPVRSKSRDLSNRASST